MCYYKTSKEYECATWAEDHWFNELANIKDSEIMRWRTVHFDETGGENKGEKGCDEEWGEVGWDWRW